MTKNDLINLVYSLEIDLKYLKKDLQFRLEGNDVENTLEKYKDAEYKYANQSGAFQAMVQMDNSTFKRSIETIKKMQEKLGEAK